MIILLRFLAAARFPFRRLPELLRLSAEPALLPAALLDEALLDEPLLDEPLLDELLLPELLLLLVSCSIALIPLSFDSA